MRKTNSMPQFFRPALAILILLGTLRLASAQGTTAASTSTNSLPTPPKNPWETTAALGITLTRGNSKTFLGTLTLDSKKKWDTSEVLLGAAAGYGEDHDVKNTEFANGYGQYNRLFTDRFYAGLRLSANYDGIAGLQYRVEVSPLAGYYLVKQTNTTFKVEAGPSAVFEKHLGENEKTYAGLRLGERFEHKLSATTKIWESVDYLPRVDEWTHKYIITSEAGIDSAINKHWSLRLVLQDIYDSSPTPGRLRNDMRLIAGTAYKF
jgi:putative salt-induced outer membrane protein YdiY